MMLKNRHILAAMGVMTGMLALAQPAAVMAGTTTSTEYQQINHYNTPAGFMNDIQTLFKGADGYFHLYYLLNSNYKSDNDGTEWYHVRTRDWEHFENQGVAIPKFTHGWSAVATGSVIDNASVLHELHRKRAASVRRLFAGLRQELCALQRRAAGPEGHDRHLGQPRPVHLA